jgi:hypothetical protein
MRSGSTLTEAVAWFADRGLPLYGVNCNPEQYKWTTSPKAYAQLYIDDAALGVPLAATDLNTRPYVDWVVVEAMLVAGGIINKENFS